MNNLKRRGLKLATTSFLIALCAAMVLGQRQSAARIAFRNGLVEVERGNVWLPITLGDTLSAGDRLRTASGSVAAVDDGGGRDEVLQCTFVPTQGERLIR